MTILKAELHTHLEGTIHPETASKLATRNGVTIAPERISADKNTYVYSDFLDFIFTYDEVVCPVIKQPLDYYDITFDYLQRNAKAGAIYIEMMYSPELAEKCTGIPSLEHLSAIQQAINDAENQFNIVGRILITSLRHLGATSAIQVAKEALKNRLPCVVGFGLAGDEINFPPELFTQAFNIAHEGGLPCTAHAGEFASAESMIIAMQTLPLKRIGHGVRSFNHPEAIAMLKDKNILLEVCPSSNVKLGLYPNLAAHPLPHLMEAGIKVCINSDDPPFFMSELPEEYERVQQTFEFSNETMVGFTRNAIEAAFVDEVTKATLLSRLAESY
jgi:adenosine deaminase